MSLPEPADIIAFWREAGPKRWWAKDAAFDQAIRDRFAATLDAARAGTLDHWAETPDGALALLIVLDQFSRNLLRGDGATFASDAKARAIADAAIAKDFDQRIAEDLRPFLYMPFEHSEDLADQERSVKLFEALGNADMLPFAIVHRDIIARFGRFPHRNAMLGRETTPEEQAFLDEGGFAG